MKSMIQLAVCLFVVGTVCAAAPLPPAVSSQTVEPVVFSVEWLKRGVLANSLNADIFTRAGDLAAEAAESAAARGDNVTAQRQAQAARENRELGKWYRGRADLYAELIFALEHGFLVFPASGNQAVQLTGTLTPDAKDLAQSIGRVISRAR